MSMRTRLNDEVQPRENGQTEREDNNARQICFRGAGQLIQSEYSSFDVLEYNRFLRSDEPFEQTGNVCIRTNV